MVSSENLQTKKEPMSFKKALFLLGCFLILLFIGGFIPENLMYAKTNSVGKQLFYLKKGKLPTEKISIGQFVIFPFETDLVPDCAPCLVVKKVGCDEGDLLKVDDSGSYFCNDEYLGTRMLSTNKEISVEPFVFNGQVPEDHFFAFGRGTNSYDSRYYGFISKEKVEGVAIPIF